MTYGGVESLLVPWYTSQLTGTRVVTETPSDLQAQVPLVRLVAMSDIADPVVTRWREIRWILQFYAVGSPAAAALAEQGVAVTMNGLRGQTLAGAGVTFVAQDSGPSWVPYADTQVRQYVASFNGRILLQP